LPRSDNVLVFIEGKASRTYFPSLKAYKAELLAEAAARKAV
jgi:hypothetical protein